MGIFKRNAGPIGVVCDGNVVRLAQTCADGRELLATAHAVVAPRSPSATRKSNEDLQDGREASGTGDKSFELHWQQLGEAISTAYRTQPFQGRDIVMCVRTGQLTLLNVRVPTGAPDQIESAVLEDVRRRLPSSNQGDPGNTLDPNTASPGSNDAVIRFVKAGTIQHADTQKCEVVAMACEQQRIEDLLSAAEVAHLNPIAIDIEPGTLQRAYFGQFRREEERKNTTVLLHIGLSATCIVIHHKSRVHLAKHLPVGGEHMNDAVARSLELSYSEASRLRNRATVGAGSPEIQAAIQDAIRPLIEQVAREIAMCTRYYSVTFRASRVDEILLMGPEASDSLAVAIQQRTGVPCERSRPLERMNAPQSIRQNHWDLPIGLALNGVLTL